MTRETFAVGRIARTRSAPRSPWGSLKRRATRAIRRFGCCARGIAAIEFAFIAPVMLVMLLGAVEVTRAIAIDRRLTMVTATVADLVSREEQLTSPDITAIYDIVAQVMSPFETAPLSISIIPVKSRNGATVVYAASQNVPSFNSATQFGRCDPMPVAAGLVDSAADASDSVILVRASYAYSPLFVGMILNNARWEEQSFAKPRRRSCVDFEGANSCVTACT